MLKKMKLKKIIIFAFCIYALTTFIRQEIMMGNLEDEIAAKTKQLSQIESEKKDIQAKIDKKDDIENIEQIARDELNMVRPNEIVYEDVGSVE